MSIEDTRKVIEGYLGSAHGADYLAEEVVFVQMATGQEDRGKEQVLQAMQYFYQIAFKATFEKKNLLFADGQAVLEANRVGVHTGEFASIPATEKQVRVPFCVVYDVQGGKIRQVRVYMMMSALLQQLRAQAE